MLQVTNSRKAGRQHCRKRFSIVADFHGKLSVDVLQRISERVVEHQTQSLLRQSGYYPVRLVTCEVAGQVIVLRGHVPSFYMKQIAQTVVRNFTQGNWRIDNQVEVDHGEICCKIQNQH